MFLRLTLVVFSLMILQLPYYSIHGKSSRDIRKDTANDVSFASKKKNSASGNPSEQDRKKVTAETMLNTPPEKLQLAKISIVSTAESEALKTKLSANLRFCDDPILNSACRLKTMPWKLFEKLEVSKALEDACCLAPGLVQRVLAYPPLTVYRVTGTKRIAEAYPPFVNGSSTELGFANGFFNEEESKVEVFNKLYPIQIWTVLHEFSHLADAGHKTSSSPEWLKLLPKVLESKWLALRLEGSNAMCWDIGVPSEYAATNEREALAEYCAAMVLVKNKSLDHDIETFVKQKLLLEPSSLDASIPANFEANKLSHKRNCNINDLTKAIAKYNHALEFDPGYLEAKYGKQFAELRLEELKKKAGNPKS